MFRTLGQSPLLNCTNRKFLVPKTDNFDSEGNLIFINTIGGETPQDAKEGTPVGSLFNTLCQAAAATAATDVAGTYGGMITMTFKSGAKAEEKISITIEETANNDFKVTYKAAAGVQGQGVGKIENGTVESFPLQSTTPGCPGSYEASLKFADDAVTFSFKGEDCAGPMEGNGTAKRVKA